MGKDLSSKELFPILSEVGVRLLALGSKEVTLTEVIAIGRAADLLERLAAEPTEARQIAVEFAQEIEEADVETIMQGDLLTRLVIFLQTGHLEFCDVNDKNIEGIKKPCNCRSRASVPPSAEHRLAEINRISIAALQGDSDDTVTEHGLLSTIIDLSTTATKTACKHDSPQDCEKWHADPKNCCTTDETNESLSTQCASCGLNRGACMC